MIRNIIYVEDGSIDVDALSETVGKDTFICVYRQGANPPTIKQLEEPINTQIDNYERRKILNMLKIKQLFRDLCQMKKSKKVAKKCAEIYKTLFED